LDVGKGAEPLLLIVLGINSAVARTPALPGRSNEFDSVILHGSKRINSLT
jgi:hypothetical protein